MFACSEDAAEGRRQSQMVGGKAHTLKVLVARILVWVENAAE